MSDAIFRRPDRPLEVEPSDLHGLRLHLLLCGPTPHEVTARFAKERDVREKRQLSILQTEREAFERAYAKLPTIRIPRRRPAPAPEKGEQAPSAPAKEDAASVSERTSTAQSSPPPASPEPSRPPWAVTAENALTIGTPAAIASAMREVAPHARAHGEDFALAESLLRRGIEKLERHALAVTIEARTGDQARTTDVARDVLDLAQALDQGPAKAQALARWVRGRALVIVSTSAPMALDLGQLNVVAWESERDAMALLRDAEGKISSLEKLAEERARMVAAGVDAGLRHEADAAWHTGLTVVFEEITVLCDSALRSAATAALKADPTRGLRQILGDVGAVLELLRDLEARAVQLGLSASLRTTVIGPRLAPLLAHTFGRIDADDRRGYIAEVERARSVLAGAGLADVVPVGHWLTWAAHALLRAEASAKHDEAHAVSHDGYRSLRMAESRVPCGFVLAEVALRTAPTSPARASLPPQAADGLNTDSDQGSGLPLVASLLTALPDAQRRDIAAADKARVERILSFLEKFWASVEGPVGIESRAIAESQLRVLVESRFFAIALDEGAVLRTKLEIDLLRDLFPEEQDAAVALHGRVDALVGRARRRVLSLVKLRGEAEWSEALAKAGAAGSRA